MTVTVECGGHGVYQTNLFSKWMAEIHLGPLKEPQKDSFLRIVKPNMYHILHKTKQNCTDIRNQPTQVNNQSELGIKAK